jgi:hypothetical protein
MGAAAREATSPLDYLGKLLSNAGKAVLGFAGAMADFFTFGFFDFESAIVDNWSAFVESLHYFFVELPAEAFGKMWKSAKETAGKVGAVFSKAWQGIKDGAAAIIDGLTYPFKRAWEIIKSTWSWLWPGSASPMMVAVKDGIVAGADAIKDMLIAPFKKAAKFIKGGWNFAKNVAGKIKDGVGAAVGKAKELGTAAMKGLGNAIDGGKKFMKKGFGFAKNFFTGKYHKKFLKGAFNLGKNAMKGLKDGVNKFKKDPIGSIKSAGKGLLNMGKKILRIGSPSQAFYDQGHAIGDGLKMGIDASMAALKTFGPEMIEAMGVDASTGELTAEAKGVQTALEAMNNILGGVKDIIDMMTEVPNALKQFDPEVAKREMAAKMTGFKDMMTGPDGMFSAINDMQTEMNSSMMGSLGPMREMSYAYDESSGADVYFTQGEQKMLDDAKDKIRGTKANKKAMKAQYNRLHAELSTQARDRGRQNIQAEMFENFRKQNEQMMGNLNMVSDLASTMSNIQKSMVEMAEIGPAISSILPAATAGMTVGLEGVNSILTTASLYVPILRSAKTDITDLRAILEPRGSEFGILKHMNTAVKFIQTWFLSDYIPAAMSKRIETAKALQGHLTELVQEINTINTIATGIPNIELKATIDDIEDSLSIVQEFTKIKDKPISLNFALDIHIEAEKLAKAILQTETAQVHLPFKKAPPA